MAHQTFAGSKSMSVNYEQGVDTYYARNGADYRNPHFPGIVKAAGGALQQWLRDTVLPSHTELPADTRQALAAAAAAPVISGNIWAALRPRGLAGTAEASPDTQKASLEDHRHTVESAGAADDGNGGAEPGTGAGAGADESTQLSDEPAQADALACTDGAPRNSQPTCPELPIPAACTHHHAGPTLRLLDLACGSGEATQAVAAWWAALAHAACEASTADPHTDAAGGDSDAADSVAVSGLSLCLDAADPYTGAAFAQWTGRACETFSFEDVASGYLLDEGRSYHLVICSYAMHVLDTSYLYATLQQLALVCEALLIISPHKLPQVDEETGWSLQQHDTVDRVHTRLYKSTILLAESDLQLLT